MMITPCECSEPGYCKRHCVRKNAHWFKLCKTRPDYFALWEMEKGPGQNPFNPKVIVIHGKSTKIKDLFKEGVGTELKKILSWFQLVTKKGCGCHRHQITMNRWGPDKCYERMETIIGWLRDEATERSLPFSNAFAKYAVKLAIKRTIQKQQKNSA